MTKEIVLHCMKSASELERELCEECPIYGQTGCDHCYEDVLQYIIRMLEQEPCKNCCNGNQIEKAKLCQKSYLAGMEHKQQPILDKIRERIELEKLGYPPSAGYYKAIMKCLQIIDKYKAESEEDE